MPPATVDDIDNLGEGDSHLVLDLLPEDENWMEKLKQEVQFRVMLHRGAMDIFVFKSILLTTFLLQGVRFLDWSQYKARTTRTEGHYHTSVLPGRRSQCLTRQRCAKQSPNLSASG